MISCQAGKKETGAFVIGLSVSQEASTFPFSRAEAGHKPEIHVHTWRALAI